MKKLFPIIAISFLLVLQANAQTRSRYAFDNFDTSQGVKVAKPAVATPAPQKNQPSSKNQTSSVQISAKDKKLVKKTGQQTQVMTMQDAVSVRNNPKYSDQSTGRTIMSYGSSMGGFTTGDSAFDSYIVNSSLKYNIDPLLIYAQMHQESSFKRSAISNKGASGLMQLMPATARRFGVTNIFDPQQNIEAGIRYMRWLLDTFNQDLSLALAGYNAGEGAVMKYGYTIPPYNETREYVRRISNRYNAIKNPNAVKMPVKKVNTTEVAKLDKKGSAPLTVYERSPMAVRLPDGRMRLVNQ